MPEYDNTNRIALWRNERKREGKKDPDFTGTVDVDGDEYEVSLWGKKPGASAKAPVLSGSIKRKGDSAAAYKAAKDGDKPPFEDQIPF